MAPKVLSTHREQAISGASCGYQGRHFGASYTDAGCVDGRLWDLDSCDEPGGPLCIGGNIPCPRCNTKAYVQYHEEQHPLSGNAKDRRRQRRKLVCKVRAWAMQEGGAA